MNLNAVGRVRLRLGRACLHASRAGGPELGAAAQARLFAIDLEQCPYCGGELKIIAAIIDAPVIERILTHLGLCARAPPRSPAQAPALLHAA